jgi:hypothetical protein
VATLQRLLERRDETGTSVCDSNLEIFFSLKNMNDDHSVELRDSESNKRARTDFGTEAGLGSSTATNKDYDDAVSSKSINREH